MFKMRLNIILLSIFQINLIYAATYIKIDCKVTETNNCTEKEVNM